jgi:CelD/BcsL family acetyltransferase involved in cellulose biosynthesis
MQVRFSSEGTDFLSRDWTALVEADPAGTFFHTPAYLKLYWEEFGGSSELRLAFIEDGGETAGVCAFERVGSTIRFLGGTEVTDYLGPVAGDAEREAVALALIDALAARDDWELADLRNLPEDSPWLDALTACATERGLWHQVEEQDVCPFLPLPASFEEYLTALPGKLRHEIKRKARKLDEATGGYRVVFAGDDTIADDLERFFTLHRSSEGPKGKFMQPGMEIFFRRLAEAFLPSGVFRLGFVEVNGEKVAGAIGFVLHDRFLLYNSAFDHEWKPLSPGMVLVADLIRASIEEGLGGFDMLKGGLEYKYRFGSVPRRLMRLQFSRKL